MALWGLFGNDQAMAGSKYAGRESATQRRERKQQERAAQARKDAVRRHRRAAVQVDRAVAATEDTNRRGDNAPGRRARGWW